MILLDTHVLMWMANERQRIGGRALEIILDAVERSEAAISALSLFEIATLRRRARVTVALPLPGWLETVGEALRIIPVDTAIAIDAGSLADVIHGDPVDRTIIATARCRNGELVTADRSILRHGAAGHLRTIDARH